MSEHKMPETLEQAKALGYERIENLEEFLRETLGLTVAQFDAKHHQFSKSNNGVDCARNPSDTPCYSECDPIKHVGIFGVCGPNGTCDLYHGRC